MRKCIFYIFIFLLSSLESSYSQTYPFRTYSIQDGLSESVVRDLIQDEDGYIWLATGYGLNRFDGINFDNFFEDQGLNHSKIYALHQASDGKIWVGTEQGVNYIENDSIYSPVELSVLDNSQVISIFEDQEGHLWFGTDGDGVWHYLSKNELALFSISQGFKSNQIRAITESKNGDLWFATRDGLTLLSDGNLRTFTSQNGLPDDKIRDVKVDDDDYVWIATRSGLSKFDGEIFQNFGVEDGLIDERIQTLSIAEDGSIWIGTEKGISQFKNNHFENYTTIEGLSNDIINSSIIDKEGNVWFGTFGGGVSLFLGNYFENYNMDSGLSNDLVTSIAQDKVGTLWISTYGGGMMTKTESGFKYLTKENGLLDDRIYHLSKDSKDRLWIGMRDGLAYLKDDKVTTISENEFPFRKIRNVFEAKNGTLWISTYDEGIIELTEKGFKQYDQSLGMPSNTTLKSVEDDDGNIWVATYAGVAKIGNEGIETFSIQHGLPNNGVMSIIKDVSGTIWVSTFGGIAWFDGLRFVDITVEDGLPDKVCYFITQDEDRIFWIGTNAGIARLDVAKFYSNDPIIKDQAIQVISREQGLVSDEMNLGAVYEDNEGHFWFGSVEGVSHFKPKEYIVSKTAPKVHILSFIASGREYQTKGLELSHSKNSIEINFAGINFKAPNQVTYEYKMSGIDPEWQKTTNRYAKYPSIPPGDYIFQVRAKNTNGIWSSDISVVKFRVFPPFWMSWWFLVLLGVTILGIIYLFYRNYQFMQMVDIERIRVRIASDLHDDVGASLTEIALQSDFLQAGEIDSEFKHSLNQIGKQCRRVVTSLDDIVWSIDARNDTLGDLTDRMQDYILNVLVPKNFHVTYNFEELKMDNKLPVSVKENLYLIFKEAINNIAKYSNGDIVIVSMHSKNGEYEFKVHDNGTLGRGTKKTGQGLRNMEMRAHRIGGSFDFEYTNGFEIKLTGKLNLN